MFLSILDQTAREKCHLSPDRPILVGVSGGADSMALMLGLHELGYHLVIAHLDHGIRSESAKDADYVEAAAAGLGLPFFRARLDVLKTAEEAGQSLEEAAREVRYTFLFRQAREHHAQAVAVAHQADDQVETVLMHFLRGAGLSGLSGMAYRKVMPVWDTEIPLVRPLLDTWRKDVERYLSEKGVTPRFDESNLDRTYFRNRLRYELIPNLETYNPQFRQALNRTAAVLAGDEAFLEELTGAAWKLCCLEETEGRVVLSKVEFQGYALAIRRRLLRQAVSGLRPDLRDVGFEVIERALTIVDNPNGAKTIDLAALVDLTLLEDTLVIKAREADLPDGGGAFLPHPGYKAVLPEEGALPLRNGWLLEVSVLPDLPEGAPERAAERPTNEVWLDADRLSFPLTVRGWQEGERWQPLGMGGHSQKLSDFFINAKVPEHLRGVWPLVCSGEQVVWVAGMRPAETVRVSGETKRIVRLRLMKDK
jgi:tRNA(Ile)-lysidine synthase